MCSCLCNQRCKFQVGIVQQRTFCKLEWFYRNAQLRFSILLVIRIYAYCVLGSPAIEKYRHYLLTYVCIMPTTCELR